MEQNLLTGAWLAIGTAVLWAFSPLCWASAGRRIGSFNTNVLRLFLAETLLLLTLLVWWSWHGPLRLPNGQELFWLALSGLAGVVVADILGFESMVLMGARRETLTGTLAPVAAGLLGWYWQGEKLAPRALIGAVIILASVTGAVLIESAPQGRDEREPGRASAKGYILGLTSALMTGAGAAFMRQAYLIQGRTTAEELPSLDPILVAAIRVGTALTCVAAIYLVRQRDFSVFGHLKDRHVLSRVALGTVTGPFAGMLCYVGALKLAPSGIVSTLVAMSPLVVIPMVVVRYGVKVKLEAVAVTVGAIFGVGLICWQG